jgi:CBS domain-containing protein
MQARYSLWDKPLNDICSKAAGLRVKSFMYTPKGGKYVREDTTMDEAIHQLVVGHHQSLLVTRSEEIVGILRLTDVFHEICGIIKTCKL